MGLLFAINHRLSKLFAPLRAKAARPNLYDASTPERVGVVYSCESDMSIEDSLLLYSLVRGLRPQRVLEVGAFKGGSGRVMAAAMQENGEGHIFGIDPFPKFRVDETFHGRYTLLEEKSPDAIPRARALAGGDFDFVLIDAIHTHDATLADALGAHPHTTPDAYWFFHDAFHYGVGLAVDTLLKHDPRLMDMGYLCKSLRTNRPWVGYGGVRMLRTMPSVTSGAAATDAAYARAGLPAPGFSMDTINHDGWYCRNISPCPRCVQERAREAATPSKANAGNSPALPSTQVESKPAADSQAAASRAR